MTSFFFHSFMACFPSRLRDLNLVTILNEVLTKSLNLEDITRPKYNNYLDYDVYLRCYLLLNHNEMHEMKQNQHKKEPIINVSYAKKIN